MYTDEISKLVEEAHAIFNGTSVYEVIDLDDRQSPVDFLNKNYHNSGTETINRYLDVLKSLEMWLILGNRLIKGMRRPFLIDRTE